MKMMGNCHICGKNASQSCSICGSLACDEHMHRGVCTECRKGKGEEKERDKDVSYTDFYS